MGEQDFYIYSGEHNAYWRPDASGYTTNLEEAGRYSLTEAHRKTNHCCPKKQIKIGVFPEHLQGRPAR